MNTNKQPVWRCPQILSSLWSVALAGEDALRLCAIAVDEMFSDNIGSLIYGDGREKGLAGMTGPMNGQMPDYQAPRLLLHSRFGDTISSLPYVHSVGQIFRS